MWLRTPPAPKNVVLGHVTLTNDNEVFLRAFDTGMTCYYDTDYDRRRMTAQELYDDLLETLCVDDEEMSLTWRLGFIAGYIAGLLNPDLSEIALPLSFLEALSRKCEVLYPGPERRSIYSRAIHKAACIDNVPIEGLPVLESVSLKSSEK